MVPQVPSQPGNAAKASVCARGTHFTAGNAALHSAAQSLRRVACASIFVAAPMLAAVSAPVGDASAGAKIYTRCEACHALAYDRTGPRHCGLIGRKAGSVPGFDYSAAMKRSGIVWNAKTLDRFLADPMKAVPGTTMGYAGVKDPKERADLIAFLAQQSHGPACTK
jgi:cytochrome c